MRLALWTALRSLRHRLGALLLTVLAVALATATALTVPLVSRQVQRGAQDAAQVFDLLVAAPGSPTQAVMSTLFYLDAPTGNVPHAVYQGLRDAPGTRRAVPIALGDNYVGFPIVGTSREFFDQRLKPGAPPYFRLAAGRLFNVTANIEQPPNEGQSKWHNLALLVHLNPFYMFPCSVAIKSIARVTRW